MEKPIAKYIQQLRKYGHLPDERAGQIASCCSLDLVPAGEFYLREGMVCHRQGFIAEGVMRYCNAGEDGALLTCYFAAENDLAGDPEGFARQAPSKLTLQAVTDVLVVSLGREQQQDLLARFPEFGGITALMVQDFLTSLANQRAFLLNKDAKSKYLHFLQHYPHILNRTPLGMVASYLGIKQQSLSRLRSQL